MDIKTLVMMINICANDGSCVWNQVNYVEQSHLTQEEQVQFQKEDDLNKCKFLYRYMFRMVKPLGHHLKGYKCLGTTNKITFIGPALTDCLTSNQCRPWEMITHEDNHQAIVEAEEDVVEK